MNVVFDLGGVVLKWEPDAIIASVFEDPAVRAKVRAEIVEHADWLALDRGTLALQQAITRAAKRTGLSELQVAEFFRQVPPALVPIPETVDILYRLKAKGHRLFCLSNMQVASIEHVENAYGFWNLFDGIIISCRLKLIKPEPAIYARLLEKYRLRGIETIFIDDRDANLTPAAGFGMRTIKFESPMQCERRLQALGCL